MPELSPSKTHQCRHQRRRRWCCSFTTPPLSPDNPTTHSHKKTELPSSNSPLPQKPPLSRRILSPGRVSPISDHPPVPPPIIPNQPKPPSPPPPLPLQTTDDDYHDDEIEEGSSSSSSSSNSCFDVRLNLKGKNGGGSLILELGSEVLSANSPVFADLISDHHRNNNNNNKLTGAGLCRIEVPDVENLHLFRQTIELMFEEDEHHIHRKLLKIGVFRAIDILQVASAIKFGRGVSSCLKYLEAVPWTEEEEEKLRDLFTKLNFDEATAKDISDRLFSINSVDSQRTLAKQLISSITTCTDANARNELKSLVKGLLCKSSVYEKDHTDLNKDDIYSVCESCLHSLVEEASGTNTGPKSRKEKDKPLLEYISKQVDNINWLLDILLDHQMAEEFVDMWANQDELLKIHANLSPMVRYELSRISATLFIAMGTRKLHCRSESRLRLLQAWFRPMLSDFGWLQRCRKGLDMKALEEAMGQALLTLPLKDQYTLFMEWFRCFSKQGTECPNLSKAFQIWWRRSFLRGSETFAIESR